MFPSRLKTQPAGLHHAFMFAHQSVGDTDPLTNARQSVSPRERRWRVWDSSSAAHGSMWRQQEFCLVQPRTLMETRKLKDYSKRGLNQWEEGTSTAARKKERAQQKDKDLLGACAVTGVLLH